MKNGMAGSGWAAMLRRAHAAACATAAMLSLGAMAPGATVLAANTTADQATRIYNRVAGLPPTAAQLASMTATDPLTAAFLATRDPAFYNDTVRNLAAPWTNRAQSVFVPLNDYIATVVGMVRDDVPFNTLLSADLVYVAGAGAGAPAYSTTNNDMYQSMDDKSVDLSSKANLVPSAQSALTGMPAAATAGVLTTRAAANAFFMDGTNRRMFRFTVMNHLCSDLQTVMDITRPPDRIRQDVTRSPGGVSTLFLNNCVGCHSGMDPMAQAFAYYDYTHDTVADPTGAAGKLVYTAGQVQPKYFINKYNFQQGYLTPDDGWINRWRSGPNQIMGWGGGAGSGNGAKSLGVELESSAAFASCQVTRVFKYVCLRAPNSDADAAQVASMIASFQANQYKLRQPFAEAAAYCAGN